MAKAPSLPPSEVALLSTLEKERLWLRVQLLSESGWSLQSIADAFTPQRRRSTIRSWVVKDLTLARESQTITAGIVDLATPRPPAKIQRSRRKRPKSPGIEIPTQLHIARLAPLARRYRARTSPSNSAFSANKELTALAGELYSQGVTVSELARVSGVTYRAMKRRVDKALSTQAHA